MQFNSPAERGIKFIVQAWHVLKHEGPIALLKKGTKKLRHRLRTSPLTIYPQPNPEAPRVDIFPSWIIQNEPSSGTLLRQEKFAQDFAYTPLISIITPTFNPDPQILSDTISSVLAQTYKNWELCLVDGASDKPGVKETLEGFDAQDDRIRLTRLDKNLGISGNSNKALQMARGIFVAFLDHDDVLAPFALFEVVKKLNQDPGWDLLYSDHDLLAPDGSERYQPLFKPDWSPEIMLSANYITHLTVIRTELVRDVGGFDPQMDGAQDWELFLRISEHTEKIAHIPKILYHWRDSGGSTADDIWAKPYAPPAQLRAIQGHLTRQGLPQAEAFFDDSGFIRVKWAIKIDKKISIIIPSIGANKLLKACLNSILNGTSYTNFEIIIVNNGKLHPSEFPYYQQISQDERIRVLHYDAPFNYSAVNNYGASYANGDILLFLNNDTEVIAPDWLEELVLWAEREDIGVVGAKLLHPDGTIQHAGVIIGLTGFAGHIFGGLPENQWGLFGLAEWYRNYMAVTGACMMIRRDLFDKIGGFDESLILCGNDVEICIRVRDSGLRVVYNPFARLKHLEGASRGGEIPKQDFYNSYQHYLPFLKSGDPYFNPNLSYWQLPPTLPKQGETSPLDFVLEFLRNQKGLDENVNG